MKKIRLSLLVLTLITSGFSLFSVENGNTHQVRIINNTKTTIDILKENDTQTIYQKIKPGATVIISNIDEISTEDDYREGLKLITFKPKDTVERFSIAYLPPAEYPRNRDEYRIHGYPQEIEIQETVSYRARVY